MMSAILVKILATALTLAQVTTRPEAVKTAFDPQQDQPAVAQLLRDGCAHMVKAFDIEDVNLDDLIGTAMDDPEAMTAQTKVLRGINFGELHLVYKQYCKGEDVPNSPVDLAQVIQYYNAALENLPDHAKLKGLKLPGMSVILDGKGRRFADVYEPDHRRVWVPLTQIPEAVQRAFVAAEDKRFFQHRGVDERGVIRAFVGNLAQPGRPQGGSTITQQVVKNLLVGDDVTYERKIREMVLAARVEQALTKPEILEIYLNSIYLGRASWGVEVAARGYFGKSAKDLNVSEAAFLAGLIKGPNYYNPDRNWDRAFERFSYVLNRLREDGFVTPEEMKRAQAEPPRPVPFQSPRQTSGLYFVDQVARDAKALAGVSSLTAGSYTVRSTIVPDLQQATEAALQEGLARYERSAGRVQFERAEANLSNAIARIEAARAKAAPGSAPGAPMPAWRQALETARLPLYDVRWPAAVILEKGRQGKSGADVIRVGLQDGRVLPLNVSSGAARLKLKLHDVVRVQVTETKQGARADLRVRPNVQGAALVLENKTGRVLAMVGGFSYPVSQLNRTTQAERQPGSSLKPLTYLAALSRGLQPNTLVVDAPVSLPPVGGGRGDWWSPKNYDGHDSGIITLRRALENSKNLVTARLLDGGVATTPEQSLNRVCALAKEAHVYQTCVPHYPFVLGAQPVRPIDLATFYASVANEGLRPTPHVIESIQQGDRTIYTYAGPGLQPIPSADRVAFYQLKTILQGVLARGTAQAIKHLSPFVAGKTGTTDNENDAWFVGFTNDVTVAVWLGYDNAGGKRRTLGRGSTGGRNAVPIFEPIIQAVWAHHVPKTPLAPPSQEADAHLVAMPIDVRTGDRIADRRSSRFLEFFRTDRSGNVVDTRYEMVSRDQLYAYSRGPVEEPLDEGSGGWFQAPVQRPYGHFEPPFWGEERAYRRPRRADPFWGQIY